jgi:GDP-mannose 6-dehydrogenase
MNISVFGLGYVGCVSSACFCNKGYNLFGVDVSQEKIDLINKGKSPIKEHGLEEMLETCKANSNLFADSNAEEAVFKSDLTFITVGTPTSADGNVDLRALFEVTESIGNALSIKDEYHLIVLRSTVPPGTSRECIKRIESISSKTAGKDFGWCMNPEFLREGTAIRDFYNPPYTVIGQYDERSGDILEKLYNRFPRIFGNTFRVNLEEAEMFKYVNNAFHAVKVDFANEVGRLCDSLKINAEKIMDIFVLDKKLNLSPYYLKPGLPFGGSCLPKDTRGLSKS